jgi:hypothetical protein
MNFDTLLEDARDLTEATSSVEEVASVALRLSALASEIDEHLEPLKELLRAYARRAGPGESRVTLACDKGEVQVTFPNPSLRARPGLREGELRSLLGDLFDEAFEVVTTIKPRKGLEERLRARTAAAARPSEGKAPTSLLDVLEYLDVKEATPRVGFRPNPDILDL